MSTLQITSTGARYLYLAIRAVNPVTGEDVDLDAAVFKMALVRPNDRPDSADWVAADNAGVGLVAGQTHTWARVLVGTAGALSPAPGEYAAWVQTSLGSEVVEEACGRVKVL